MMYIFCYFQLKGVCYCIFYICTNSGKEKLIVFTYVQSLLQMNVFMKVIKYNCTH